MADTELCSCVGDCSVACYNGLTDYESRERLADWIANQYDGDVPT
jgi:hypothetical protein